MTTQEIVSKLWNLCNVLRDDGITYHQHVTELTYILFLKMAKETGAESQIPEPYRWDNLTSKSGIELKKFYKKLLLILILGYLIFTLINQQKVLNQYGENSKQLASKIEEQEAYKEELASEKENVNSKEFIEQMAREKLEMYYPNEKVYVDKGM